VSVVKISQLGFSRNIILLINYLQAPVPGLSIGCLLIIFFNLDVVDIFNLIEFYYICLPTFIVVVCRKIMDIWY